MTIKTGVDLRSAEWNSDGIALTDQTGVYHGELVVDSSGCEQAVHALLGLRRRKKLGLSYEVELEGCEIPVKDEASFILDLRVSNSGGWIYVLSSDKAQFGWADFCPESSSSLPELKARVLAAMTRIGPQRDWFQKAKVTYGYGQLLFLPRRAIDQFLPLFHSTGFIEYDQSNAFHYLDNLMPLFCRTYGLGPIRRARPGRIAATGPKGSPGDGYMGNCGLGRISVLLSHSLKSNGLNMYESSRRTA